MCVLCMLDLFFSCRWHRYYLAFRLRCFSCCCTSCGIIFFGKGCNTYRAVFEKYPCGINIPSRGKQGSVTYQHVNFSASDIYLLFWWWMLLKVFSLNTCQYYLLYYARSTPYICVSLCQITYCPKRLSCQGYGPSILCLAILLYMQPSLHMEMQSSPAIGSQIQSEKQIQ